MAQVEILKDNRTGFLAIGINDTRVTPTKCSPATVIKSWNIPDERILDALTEHNKQAVNE